MTYSSCYFSSSSELCLLASDNSLESLTYTLIGELVMLILKTFTFTKTGAICDDDMEGEVEEANAIGAFSPPCSLVSLSPCCCCSCLCRCYQSSHSWHQHYCPLCFHQYHYQQPVLSSVTVSPSPFLFSLLQLSNSTT